MKKFLTALTAILLFSQFSGSVFAECIGDCVNGQGKQTYANGIYGGEFKNGKRHGQGTFTFANANDQYVGEWKDDYANGQGTYSWANGN